MEEPAARGQLSQVLEESGSNAATPEHGHEQANLIVHRPRRRESPQPESGVLTERIAANDLLERFDGQPLVGLKLIGQCGGALAHGVDDPSGVLGHAVSGPKRLKPGGVELHFAREAQRQVAEPPSAVRDAGHAGGDLVQPLGQRQRPAQCLVSPHEVRAGQEGAFGALLDLGLGGLDALLGLTKVVLGRVGTRGEDTLVRLKPAPRVEPVPGGKGGASDALFGRVLLERRLDPEEFEGPPPIKNREVERGGRGRQSADQTGQAHRNGAAARRGHGGDPRSVGPIESGGQRPGQPEQGVKDGGNVLDAQGVVGAFLDEHDGQGGQQADEHPTRAGWAFVELQRADRGEKRQGVGGEHQTGREKSALGQDLKPLAVSMDDRRLEEGHRIFESILERSRVGEQRIRPAPVAQDRALIEHLDRIIPVVKPSAQ